MLGNTIISAPLDPPSSGLKGLILEDLDSDFPQGAVVDQRLFKIRAANTDGYRSSANILVNRRYAWRGYRTGSVRAADVERHNRITLVAMGRDEMIGTMSIGFDSSDGLFVDDLFPNEVAALRREGRTICEFTKLAMDSVVRSKQVLASLFHVAYIYAHRLRALDSLLIEVNPRHVRYYEGMLGFRTIGPQRLNRRVDAPAVLMCLDFLYAKEQINRFGGRPKDACLERSLYPYFFSTKEEAGIVGRLRGTSYRGVTPVPMRSLSAVAS